MRRLVVLLVLACAAPAMAAPSTERASVAGGGAESNGSSFHPAVSQDGRYVAFSSAATNLVPGDVNGMRDVFVRDRLRGETTRISTGPGGRSGDADSRVPVMSADGRYVAFLSSATTLVDPPTTGQQAFVWDRTTGAVRHVALPAPYTRASSVIALSAGGTRVAFDGTSSSQTDVFVAETGGGAARRVSQLAGGATPNGQSFGPALSGDGRWIAYTTQAPGIIPGDANSDQDVVVEDLDGGARLRANVTPSGGRGAGVASAPALDAAGCRIAFVSNAPDLVAGDDGSTASKTFLRDRCAGTTELLSRTDDESRQGTGLLPSLSGDGCVAAFQALEIIGASADSGVAVRDRCTQSTVRADVNADGSNPSGTGSAEEPAISAGTGRYVAFTASFPGLVAGDTNGSYDIFVRDRAVNTAPVARLAVAGLGGTRYRADAGGSTDADDFRPLTGRIAWGDGTTSAGLTGEHAFTRPGVFDVTATVIDADGATVTASQRAVIPAPPVVAPPTPRLVLDRLKLSRTRFAVAPRRGRARGNQGATLALRLSEAARVTLAFERVQRGRKRGARCVVGRRRGPRCTKVTRRGALTRALPAGAGRIALTGRTGTKALARGAYRLVVSARTADGRRTTPRPVRFWIVKGRR